MVAARALISQHSSVDATSLRSGSGKLTGVEPASQIRSSSKPQTWHVAEATSRSSKLSHFLPFSGKSFVDPAYTNAAATHVSTIGSVHLPSDLASSRLIKPSWSASNLAKCVALPRNSRRLTSPSPLRSAWPNQGGALSLAVADSRKLGM